jgi:hypothetical protein
MQLNEMLRFYIYYLIIGLPIVYIGSKQLIKYKKCNEVKANKISIICITAPILVPVLIGMFGAIMYAIGYLILKIFPDPPDVIAIPGLILLLLGSILLGIKSYISIYRSIIKDPNIL